MITEQPRSTSITFITTSTMSTSSLLYETYGALFVLLLLFVLNFINHFQFNYKCPYIKRDIEVAGKYPTLIAIYITISIIVLLLIVFMIISSSMPPQHIFLSSYSECNALNLYVDDIKFMFGIFNVVENTWTMPVLWLLSVLYGLESYFSFSRYYNILDISKSCNLCLPFTIYVIIFFILFWFSISILPIFTPFLCFFHILNNAYFSYYFHHTIKISYSHIFEINDDDDHGINVNTHRNNNTYKDMQLQVKQIRIISILSTLSSIISAFSWYFVISCNNLNILPLALSLNNIIFYSLFTKNRIFFVYLFRCKFKNVLFMLKSPCAIIKKRRESKKWIRDRQQSIFAKLQQSVVRPSIFNTKVSMTCSSNSKKRLPTHSLNNSVNDHVSNNTNMDTPVTIEIDIDPNNDILNGQNNKKMIPSAITTQGFNKIRSVSTIDLNENNNDNVNHYNKKRLSLSNRQSDSVRSDISDVFTKMKSFHTSRHNKNILSNLAKELEEIEMNQIPHEIPQIERGKTFANRFDDNEDDLERDKHILKLKKKANKQIAFGADIALEIIKETIKNDEENMINKQQQKQVNNKPKLNAFESEPVLMSGYTFDNLIDEKQDENKPKYNGICDDSVLNVNDKRYSNLLSLKGFANQKSQTVPNSPIGLENKKVLVTSTKTIRTKSDPLYESKGNKNDYKYHIYKEPKKTIFLYNRSNDKLLSSGTIVSDLDVLSRTQSLPPPIPKQASYIVPQNTLAESNGNGNNNNDDNSLSDIDFVYQDEYFYGRRGTNNGTLNDELKIPLTPRTPKTPKTPLTPNSRKRSTTRDKQNSKYGNNNNNNNRKKSDTPHTNTRSILGTVRSILSPFSGINHNKSLSRSNDPSKLLKINSFLKQNGLGTAHHQNVNDLFKDLNKIEEH